MATATATVTQAPALVRPTNHQALFGYDDEPQATHIQQPILQASLSEPFAGQATTSYPGLSQPEPALVYTASEPQVATRPQEPLMVLPAAGPHQKPRGRTGCALGAITGAVCLGPWGCLFGALAGRQLQKWSKGKGNTVSLPIADGVVIPQTAQNERQEVTVQLWKAGATAPLTEAGFAIVLSDPRFGQVDTYLRRVLAQLGLAVIDQRCFSRRFVPRCKGRDTNDTVFSWRTWFGTPQGGAPLYCLADVINALVNTPRESGVQSQTLIYTASRS